MSASTYYPLIHNKFVETSQTFDVINPYDGSLVGKVHKATDNYLDLAVQSARKGFNAMKELSSYERYEILMKIAGGIKHREKELRNLMVKEGGKPVRFVNAEIERAIFTFTWAAEEARRISGEFIPLDVSAKTKGYSGLTRRFPLGIILAITPFNFPLNLVAHKVAPAIASGNSVILKPAPQTPITALILGDIIRSTGIPAGAVNIIPSQGAEAQVLVSDGRIQMLTFTGSDKVGWFLKSIAGKKKVTLELGGNAAIIVEPDADLNFAVPRIAVGAFAHSGQVCISVQRLYVHQKIFHTFKKKLISETTENIVMGDPAKKETIVGPMTNEAAAARAMEWLEEAVKAGAKILCGGKKEGAFIEPTILTKTKQDMKVVCEEIFAPAVMIEPYSDFNEALEKVNRSYYGLQAGLFCNNIQKI
ncbi:MAG: aldehyde dehydrogenase family protein, partial [Calditrichia bacterium]